MMRKTFAETFVEELKIEQQVARKWGYALKADELCQSKVSTKTDKIMSINRNIIPREIQRVFVERSEKHKELVKEIDNHEYERKMREKSSKRNEQQFNVTNLMNERIKEYNYLVDHKHIKNKDSDDTKRVLKIKPKTEAEIILEEINMKNSELLKVEDLKTQFHLNKKITKLYRVYKDKMYEQTVGNNRKDSFNQTIGFLGRSGKGLENSHNRPNKKTRNQSFSVTKAKPRHSQEGLKNSFEGFSDEPLNIEEPYLKNNLINKNKEVEKKIQSDYDQLEAYKYKVNFLQTKMKAKSEKKNRKRVNETPSKSENIIPIEPQSLERDENSEIPELNFMTQKLFEDKERKESADYMGISFIKQKKKVQEQYFSSFLQKRNRKFKKPWGNKILIKYDSHAQAKQMLEGRSGNVSPEKSKFEDHLNEKMNYTQNISSFRLPPKNLTDEDKNVLESMKEEQNDENHYQIMCKNEKFNLYLKARKKID